MLACLLPSGAYAAALGKLTVLSGIGQPLNAEIELLSVGAAEKPSLAVKLAPRQAFSQANVEYNQAFGALQFAIETRGAAQVVRITSAEGFNEPAVDILLELSGANTPRAVREYSFLLDPPRAPGNAAQVQVKADPKPVPAVAQAGAESGAKAESKPAADQAKKADGKGSSKADSKTASKTAEDKPKSKSKAGAKPSEYKVRQGDSLSAIANRMRPAGVSLDQMLVAMYRANPDAFVGDNMSRMRAGAVLSVPDAATAGAIDRTEADSVVVAQAQDFHIYRQQLAGHIAGAPARKAGAAAQSAGGKITAKVEERATPAGQAKDKLQLSKAGAGDGMTSEDKIAADKAASEAESRIKDLEKNVNDLQKLLEIKNQNLAELSQKKAENGGKSDAAPAVAAASAATPSAPSGPSTAATPPVADATAPAATPPADTPSSTAADTAPPAADTAPAATDATVAAASDAAAAPTTDSAAKPKPVLSSPVAKPAFFEGWRENPMLLPGGGLLALVLLAWAAYRARRNRKVDPADAAAVAAAGTEPVTPPPAEPVAVVPTEPEPEATAPVAEETFVPPAEEPVAETPTVADPLFASDETAAVAAAQAEAAEQQAERDAEEGLKIDLSRMEPAPSTTPVAPPLDMSKLDFDLELDQDLKPDAKMDANVNEALDIDLAAELAAQPSAPHVPPVAPVAVSEAATPSSDKPTLLPPAIEGLSLDLNEAGDNTAQAAQPAAEGDAGTAAEQPAAEVEDDETSSFAKEINTKLDLATAYQEIGDKDGARELLDEVVKSGNRRQVAKAQEMLAQLA